MDTSITSDRARQRCLTDFGRDAPLPSLPRKRGRVGWGLAQPGKGPGSTARTERGDSAQTLVAMRLAPARSVPLDDEHFGERWHGNSAGRLCRGERQPALPCPCRCKRPYFGFCLRIRELAEFDLHAPRDGSHFIAGLEAGEIGPVFPCPRTAEFHAGLD